MKLHTLIQNLPLVGVPEENPEIKGIMNDHRKVVPGSLFVCLQGHVVDGHDFADEAVKNGAVAVVAQRSLPLDVPVLIVRDTNKVLPMLADAFFGKPTQKLQLIGVTGTNGKTTTTHLLERILSESGRRTGLIGTMYMKIGEKEMETKNTTPDSVVLQSVFSEMVNERVDSAIMEVSSHGLVQGRVDGCDFDVAVFTNLSQDHLDYHHTMEEYRRAKGLLFSRLGNAYVENKPKYAILNGDDPASDQYQTDTAAPVVTYGIDRPADFKAENIALKGSGTEFTLVTREGKYPIRMKLIGKFNVYNVLAALAAAYVCKIPLSEAIASVEEVKGVPGRFEVVDGGQDFTVIVDYAHTPDSLENVLKTISQFADKRIFALVGCGGDRDRTKRPLMAQIACRYADVPIFTADNPRSEDPLAIIKEMEAGAVGSDYKVVADRKRAIYHAVSAADPGDVILIAGKGHETYQIVGDQVFDFDDRLVALEAIKER